jgi:hypothetical protein
MIKTFFMYKKIIPAIMAILFVSTIVDAQRVKRKGTTPLVKKSKKDLRQPDFTLEQFSGKWQESSRLNLSDKTPEAIRDTIYLNFTGKNKVDTREGNNPNVIGVAEIDADNTLTVAADVYTIRSVTADEMVLDDNDKYLHVFQKKIFFWFETVGKDSVRFESLSTAIEYSSEKIMGNWMVYRRNAKPGTVSAAAPIIRYLKIKDKTGDTTATGLVTFYKEAESIESPCRITFYKTSIQIEADKYAWYLPVYKADGKEFVFGSAELMMYYCKRLE